MRAAIVIAANGPEGSRDRLKFAESDGERFAAALEQPRCGYVVQRIPGMAPASEVRERVLEAAEACEASDVFLTYFAGHGQAHKGELLLHLNGFRPDRPITTSLSGADLMKAFQACKASNRVLILDCCNAGNLMRPLGTRTGGTAVRDLGIASETFDIVTAAGFLEYAFEDEQFNGGFLTATLCDALTTRFRDADADRDGALSFEEAMRWIERRVAEVNETRTADSQIHVPQRVGSGRGISYLSRPPKEWIVHEVLLPDGTPTVVLPIAPMVAGRGKNGVEFAFLMAKRPVTNGDYKRFVSETGARRPGGRWPHAANEGSDGSWHEPWKDPNFKDPDLPVVCVESYDAHKYCGWVKNQQQGQDFVTVQLPLPEMWNIAVFGSFYDSSDPRAWMRVSEVIHHRARKPMPCIDAPERTSRLGLTDLVGNVWEWCGNKGDWIFGLRLDGEGQRSVIKYREFWDNGWLGTFDVLSYSRRYIAALLHSPAAKHKLNWLHHGELRGGGFLDNLGSVPPFLDVVRLPSMGQGVLISRSDIGFRLGAAVRLERLPGEVRETLFGCSSLKEAFEVPAYRRPRLAPGRVSR